MAGYALLTTDVDADARMRLSGMHGLVALSTKIFAERDSDTIMRLCASSAGTLATVRAEAAYLVDTNTIRAVDLDRAVPDSLRARVSALGETQGAVSIPSRAWGQAIPLNSRATCRGYLVVSASEEPHFYEQLLLNMLIGQAAVALENAALYRDALHDASALRAMSEERAAVNRRLQRTVDNLQRRTRTHEMLTRASMAPDVNASVAVALHELTGLPAAVEDRFGNILEWAAPDGVKPYERLSAATRAEAGHAMTAAAGHPIHVKRRLIALARPGNETLGAVVLLDPGRAAGEYEMFAIERAATVVGMELAHRRGLIEVELRLRGQLVEDLLAGAHSDCDGAIVRAAAIGHDLTTPQRVVLAQWRDLEDNDQLMSAVQTANHQLNLNALVARRAGKVVLVAGDDVDGNRLYEVLSADLHSVEGAIGVGGRAETVDALPRSFNEAQRALEVRTRSRSTQGVTEFDDLGIYRILALGDHRDEIENFVRQWLGRLIDYDTQRHGSLVETLASYLDCGGNYDLTSQALVIHRSTLRYRLRRIREINDLDLNDVESRLNLHVATRGWRILGDA
jgi:hypothetical protein